jgi:hypothetical protein
MTTILKKKGSRSEVVAAIESKLDPEHYQEKIAECAYELFLKRGQIHGYDVEDWLEAERMVLAEMSAADSKPSKKNWQR